ncbi:MAG: universal stress protein [Chloroflexota bacterium]
MLDTDVKQYKRMLVPLDGSPLAESVLVYVKELAARLRLNVTLLSVCDPKERHLMPIQRGYVDQLVERVERQAQDVRRTPRVPVEVNGTKVHGEVVMGDPAEEIVRCVDTTGIDLVVMATHGRSGIKRWAMGSVAEKVLHAANVPIWLVRANASTEPAYDAWPKKTMVVPLDGSPLAESILSHVVALAHQENPGALEVVLICVCEYAALPDSRGKGPASGWEIPMRREIARAKRQAKRYLLQVERQVERANMNVRSEALVGEPASVITDFANRLPCSIVAMAAHGRSGLSRWAYGSVADKVLHSLCRPLLLVRPV